MLKSINRLSNKLLKKSVCGGGIRSSLVCETLVCHSISLAQAPTWGGQENAFLKTGAREAPGGGGGVRGHTASGDQPVPPSSPPPNARSCLGTEGLR